METIGKLISVLIVIGGIGLGVHEIINQDYTVKDIALIRSPTPSKKAEINVDRETIRQYKSKLIEERDYVTPPSGTTLRGRIPNKLWGTAKEASAPSVQNADHESITLAETLAYNELKKEMLYWHKRYHYLLRRSPHTEETRTAYEQYKKYKKAIELKNR